MGELSLNLNTGYTFHVDPSCFLIHINHEYFDDEYSIDLRIKLIEEFETRFINGYLRKPTDEYWKKKC